jgi:hypothetical protein
MKKFYTLIFAFLFVFGINAQTVYKMDSSEQYSWNGADWDLISRVVYTFGNGGNKETRKLTQTYNNPGWTDVSDVISEYNASNNLTRATTRNWNGVTWDNFSKKEHDYDANQNVIETRQYSLIVSPTLDVVFIQANFAYNAANLQTEQIWKLYDILSMTLKNSTRTTTTYNAMNTRAEETVLYTWNGVSWDETTKLDYFYDGLKLERVEETPWDMGDWAALPNKQTLYAYNGSDLPISAINQDWIGGVWVNTFGVFTDYNGNITTTTNRTWNTGTDMWDDTTRTTTTVTGNVTVILEEEWNSGTVMWDEESRTTRTVDANGNITEAIYEEEPPADRRALENATKVTFVWSVANNLSVSIEEIASIKVYPNPFKSKVTLSFQEPIKNNGGVKLYDVAGKLLAEKKVNQGDVELSFKLPFVAQGIYFIDVNADGIRGRYKVIKD